jgi:vacuolar protein sorting-associated protein 13A/C
MISETVKVKEKDSRPLESPVVIMSTEKANINIPSVRLVLIDDLNDLHLPMLDVTLSSFLVDMSDWSTNLRLDSGLAAQASYFNVKNSHWEPLIEPWQCSLSMSKAADTQALSVEFYSRKKLDINLTHVFVETVLNSMALLNKQKDRTNASRKGVHSPYILRNHTGYDIHLWAESHGDGLDTQLHVLDDGKELPWRFDDWRTMRETTSPHPNTLAIQLHGPTWETLKGITVDREGVTMHLLRPKVNGVTHRLVCEVVLKDNVKIVTFRSGTVVRNDTRIPVDLRVFNTRYGVHISKWFPPVGCWHYILANMTNILYRTR